MSEAPDNAPSDNPTSAPAEPDSDKPLYKGEPLDAEAGPGLGCFWIQVVLLAILLVLTPLTVVWAFPPWVSAALLILTLVILFFVGMTVVFLLRLVAADRRSQRRPLRQGARRTVGQLEEDAKTGQDGPTSSETNTDD